MRTTRREERAMTKEEAIKELELIAQVTMWNERRLAVEMAIEALRAKIDGDLISRADAMGAVQDHFNAYGFKGYYDGQRMMDRINALPSAETDGWIPCSERLPNEDENEDECEWYLVTVKGHELFVDVAPFEDELWKGLASHQKAIAWMPLPKPYKEESEVVRHDDTESIEE